MITIDRIEKRELISWMPFPQACMRNIHRLSDNRGTKPEAHFNPSIVEVNGLRWMAYRVEAQPYQTWSRIAIAQCNEHWHPMYATNRILHLHSRYEDWCVEDPRFFVAGPELYLSYGDGHRLAMGRVDSEVTVEAASYFEADFRLKPVEKNWVFFFDTVGIFGVYQIVPHQIIRHEWYGARHCVSHIVDVPWEPRWEWGELRGGTSPVMHNGHWWHFFHSHLETPDEPFARTYYAGAYLFEGQPKFKPVAITKKPLLVADAHGVPRHIPFRVVFPAGAVRKKEGWVLSFGEHDWNCCIAHIPDGDIELRWL